MDTPVSASRVYSHLARRDVLQSGSTSRDSCARGVRSEHLWIVRRVAARRVPASSLACAIQRRTAHVSTNASIPVITFVQYRRIPPADILPPLKAPFNTERRCCLAKCRARGATAWRPSFSSACAEAVPAWRRPANPNNSSPVRNMRTETNWFIPIDTLSPATYAGCTQRVARGGDLEPRNRRR